MYIASLPFQRGKTYFDGQTTDTTSWEGNLGQKYVVLDTAVGTSRTATGRPVTLIAVRNESGSTLAANRAVYWTANEEGISIGGYCDPTHPSFAGYVDDAYGSNTIADDDIFYIVAPDGSPIARFGNTDQLIPHVQMNLTKQFGTFGPADDFTNYLANGGDWTETKDGSVAPAVRDEVNGVLRLTCDVNDNDEVILGTEGECFLFADDKPIVFGARVKVTEVNTDDANVLVGLVSGTVSSAIGDNGGGPPSSYSGACFFKVDGGTVWQAETSIAGTQNTDTNTGTLTTATYYKLYCEIYPTSSTSATALFYIDDSLVHTSVFTYTGATEMRFLVGVHNGGGAAEIMDVDYAFCKQLR